MDNKNLLKGVFAAAITPLKPDLSPDLDGLTNLIYFLAKRGCHGILLTGTTGEGPSFSIDERLVIYRHAAEVRQNFPDLQLFAGTGTPSLEDTIFLTKSAFNYGFDCAVVLPPYYFRKATDEGLFEWFSVVIEKSMPKDGSLLGYHIPPVSGVGLSMNLLKRLKESYSSQFKGIKDSSSDPEWARALGTQFGSDLIVLNGNDRLLTLALNSNASGCITAMANLLSPIHREIWDNFQAGIQDEINQERLNCARDLFDRYTPVSPLIKLMLARLHGFPSWKVKPPLLDFDPDSIDVILSEYLAVLD